MNKRQVKVKKKEFIEVFRSTATNLSQTCSKLQISKSNFYDWYHNDEIFRKAVDEVREGMIDFAESMLFQNIKNGDNTAIIFYLKTMGRHRGYVEYQRLPSDFGNSQPQEKLNE